MYSIAHKVGRILEIHISSPVSLDEVGRWARDHESTIARIEGPYVCFVDLVDAMVFPQDVFEAYVRVMKNEPRLMRTATLLPSESPTLAMQIQRMIREANHPNRRAFQDPNELEEWFGELLDESERRRLRDLLAPRRAAPVSSRMPSSSRSPTSNRSPSSSRAPSSSNMPGGYIAPRRFTLAQRPYRSSAPPPPLGDPRVWGDVPPTNPPGEPTAPSSGSTVTPSTPPPASGSPTRPPPRSR